MAACPNINDIKLTQVEADVVIVVYNPAEKSGATYPLWECELSDTDLLAYALQCALDFTESCGGGYSHFAIRDYRMANATASTRE